MCVGYGKILPQFVESWNQRSKDTEGWLPKHDVNKTAAEQTTDLGQDMEGDSTLRNNF